MVIKVFFSFNFRIIHFLFDSYNNLQVEYNDKTLICNVLPIFIDERINEAKRKKKTK